MAEKKKVIRQDEGKNWVTYNGDCIEILKEFLNESIDYSIFSPPFASLFTYSNSNRDLGNSKSIKVATIKRHVKKK